MEKEETKKKEDLEKTEPAETGEVKVNPEEEITPEGSGEESPVEDNTNHGKLLKMLSEKFGYDPNDNEVSAGKIIAYINSNDDQDKKMSEALSKDPKLAQLLSDVVSGKRSSANALGRYFGKDFLSAEEGSKEYQDLIAGEEERKKESEKSEASKKEYQGNIEKSMPVIENFCKEKGYNQDEFLGNIWDKIISPIMSGIYTPETLGIIDNGFNYDKDVKDALAAGEVKGRNTNIHQMQERKGDGMPKGVHDASVSIKPKKPGSSSIFDLASQA